MGTDIRLTSQQQAIVNHNLGPALVYAVAGAGKTTALVHRVARLVRDDIFPARSILVSSFNKDANRQIEAGLHTRAGCRDVRVLTLHALGYAVIKTGMARGHLPAADLSRALSNPYQRERALLMDAMAVARSRRLPMAVRLDALDGDHFLAYVRLNKSRLAYPNLKTVDLPRAARRIAQTAAPPENVPWYRDLYALFEETRTSQGALTFDDLLLTGWELLVTHPDLLETMQRRHRCVLVDEFQDVNRAQVEILDLITRPGRNLMVIGDDDQTIYQWRGADPALLRTFRKRYRAKVYFMTDNFRGRAVHVALANLVIRRDPARQAKSLQLTRGFAGHAEISQFADDEVMAEAIARAVIDLHARGMGYGEMAVLVRIYAQTGPIEDALRRASIPFTVIGENGASPRQANGVILTSIYRAKGLEWPAVFVPGCNDGMLPYRHNANPDEERRLLYVAVTRAREQLFLFARQDRALSPFLAEADPVTLLAVVAGLESALQRSPTEWQLDDYLAVAVNAKRLYLRDYFAHWWPAPPATRRAVATAVLRFFAALQQARLFRKLDLHREDVRHWRAVAGTPVDETPLTDPALLTAVARLVV